MRKAFMCLGLICVGVQAMQAKIVLNNREMSDEEFRRYLGQKIEPKPVLRYIKGFLKKNPSYAAYLYTENEQQREKDVWGVVLESRTAGWCCQQWLRLPQVQWVTKVSYETIKEDDVTLESWNNFQKKKLQNLFLIQINEDEDIDKEALGILKDALRPHNIIWRNAILPAESTYSVDQVG